MSWKNKKRWLAFPFLLSLLLCLHPAVQGGAKENSVTAQIPVEKQIAGEAPEKECAFYIRILPDKEGFPLPDEGGRITLNGEENKTIPISYTELGVYTYTLYEEKEEEEGYTYDSTQYRLVVKVLNEADGWQTVVNLYKEGDSSFIKQEKALFVNQYEKKHIAESAKTGDGGMSMIQIQILGGLCIAAGIAAAGTAAVKYRRRKEKK